MNERLDYDCRDGEYDYTADHLRLFKQLIEVIEMMEKNRSRARMAGYIAGMAALMYALPHFWWGLGIGLAFPGDFEGAPGEFWSVLIGYWGMGVLAVFGALFALAFAMPWGERLPKLLLLIPAWIGSAGLTLWGFSYFVLKFQLAIGRVQSAPAFAVQDASPMAVWGYFWYGLFLVWGISLGTAALYTAKIRKEKTEPLRVTG